MSKYEKLVDIPQNHKPSPFCSISSTTSLVHDCIFQLLLQVYDIPISVPLPFLKARPMPYLNYLQSQPCSPTCYGNLETTQTTAEIWEHKEYEANVQTRVSNMGSFIIWPLKCRVARRLKTNRHFSFFRIYQIGVTSNQETKYAPNQIYTPLNITNVKTKDI